MRDSELAKSNPIDPDQYDLLTFDCYGTLIDWETGIADALTRVVQAHGLDVGREDLLAHFSEVEHPIQAGPYLPYREVLSRALQALGDRLGFQPSETERQDFGGSVEHWPSFPDSPEALARLQKRYNLAIVSNVDDDLFAFSAQRLGVEFDWVVTARQVESYKPHPGHFHEMFRRFGGPRERILHVAQSLFHDVVPARQLGLTTLWINRRGGRGGTGATPPAEVLPHAEVPDMAGAATLLLGD